MYLYWRPIELPKQHYYWQFQPNPKLSFFLKKQHKILGRQRTILNWHKPLLFQDPFCTRDLKSLFWYTKFNVKNTSAFALCLSNLKGFNAFVLDSLLLCPLVQLQLGYWLRLSENEKEKKRLLFSHSAAISPAFTFNPPAFPLPMVQVQIRHFHQSRKLIFFLALDFWKIKCYFQKWRQHIPW